MNPPNFQLRREKEQEEAKRDELYDVIEDGNTELARELLEGMQDPCGVVNSYFRGQVKFHDSLVF